MTAPLTIRPTRWHVLPEGEPIFSEQAYSIEIEDEAAGEFVRFTSNVDAMNSDGKVGVISIDTKDWPTVRKVIDMAVKECRQ